MKRQAQAFYPVHLFAAVLVALMFAPLAFGQNEFKFNTIYVCKGTRVVVRSCVDNSNNPYNDCIVELPERPRQANGNPATVFQLHSTLANTLPTCFMMGPAAGQAGAGAGHGPAVGGNGPVLTGGLTEFQQSLAKVLGLGFDLVIGLGILAFIGWRIYKKIFYSRYLTVRRSNKAAIEEFGPDRASREHKILEVFDSMDHTFNLVGENRMMKMRFTLLRNIRTFKRKDLESLRFAYFAFNRGLIDEEKFYTYRITAIYQGGNNDPVDVKHTGLFGWWRKRKTQGAIQKERQAVAGFAQSNCTPNLHTQTFSAIQALVRKFPNEPFYSDMERRFIEGSRWMDTRDVQRSAFRMESPTPFYQQLGLLDGTKTVLTYSGDGSLLTIAPPGQGKTTCNVIPNLLRWPGAAVVLDVKGEIYEKTSKWRAANVGPVIKFSPLDPENSKCYNPLAFVRRESLYIWEDASNAANMMIVPGHGGDKNKFFEDSARDILTAIIADLAYWNRPEERPMTKVLSILNRNGWDEFLDRLRKNPDVTAMQDLGASLTHEHAETLSNILSFARTGMASWKGERISRVTRQSDWHPLDLRNGKRPTIYICINPEDIKTYASLLRVFIAQHINVLLSQKLPPQGAEPIAFYLDEFPQLGGMEPIETALAVGRGYGLRLWLFAQDFGQIEKSYTNAKGLMEKCLVRTFMNPTVASAQIIAEEIGEEGVAAGADEQSSVSPQELAGPMFKDLQIVVGQSSKPAKVRKLPYYKDPEMTARVGSLDDVPPSRPAQPSAGAGATAGGA